jgi:general secretion pathway protein K
LAADSNNNVGGGPEAFLAGRIQDAQARYNLRNLVSDEQQLVTAELATLERLCDVVDLPPEVARRVALGLRASWSWKPLNAVPTSPATGAPGNAADDDANRPLRVERLEQLTWLGVDASTVQRLRPFVDVLPVRTPVNVNTASREVLAAVLNIDAGSAERLVRQRQRGAYTALDKVRAQLPENTPVEGNRLSVQTGFFWVSGRLRLEERVLEERSLVQRRGTEVVTLMREKRSDMALSAWMPTERPR